MNRCEANIALESISTDPVASVTSLKLLYSACSMPVVIKNPMKSEQTIPIISASIPFLRLVINTLIIITEN